MLAAGGRIRINRQVTDKAHARLRLGDVLTVPVGHSVRVVRVLGLGVRRGPAAEARLLYEDLTASDVLGASSPDSAAGSSAQAPGAARTDQAAASCAGGETSAYRAV